MSQELKEGDVVYLNSNPETNMTIQSLDANNAICVWLDKKGELKQFEFPTKLLTKKEKRRTSIGIIRT
ncbi:MAG: hypothetical protein ACOWWR_15810 [Eubacteriales bacterium]